MNRIDHERRYYWSGLADLTPEDRVIIHERAMPTVDQEIQCRLERAVDGNYVVRKMAGERRVWRVRRAR